MTSLKNNLTVLLLLLIAPAFAQNSQSVFLRWKVKPGEVITYRTIMQDVDTANTKFPLFKGMDKSTSDSSNAQFKKLMEGLKKERENDSTVTILYEKKKDIIDIAMISKHNNVKDDTAKINSDYQKFQSLISKMSTGVMLRGAIHEDGTIQSFYTKTEQKNLIASFFELPARAVKIGDSWPISVHYVNADQSFECDSSYYRNLVTVTGIVGINNDKIVALKYDLVEFVKGQVSSPFNAEKIETIMKFTYQATAEFSIEKGRWLKYDGIMSSMSSGMMTVQGSQRFSLIPE